MDHSWAKFDGEDSLGPSVNFQWWRCHQCGSQVRTAKDSLAVYYGKESPAAPSAGDMFASEVEEDCDQQVVRAVHLR